MIPIDPATAKAVFMGINASMELINAGATFMNNLAAKQLEREAEGKSLELSDVQNLMDSGDQKAALEKAIIAAAQLAKAQS